MEEFKPPCEECGGRCCNYVAVELEKPKGKKDYDSIRWYLAHKNVNVFVDHSKNWFVEFRTPCDKKNLKNRCTIYNTRPVICRNHGNFEGSCEHYDTPYKEYFSTVREFEKYLENRKIDWKFKFFKK